MYVRVMGVPQPQGSKNPWGGEANKNTRPWRGHVSQVVGEAWGEAPVLLGPVWVEVTFAFPRPKSHFRTGKNAHLLRGDAPHWKQGKPDADKLQRAIGDSLTGVVMRDDAQIVKWSVNKIYADQAYADINVYDLTGGQHDTAGTFDSGAREGAGSAPDAVHPRLPGGRRAVRDSHQ